MDPELSAKLDEIHGTCTELRETQVEQGQTLARLDERSRQQDRRLDRVQKQATGTGGVAGGVIAALVAAAAHFLRVGVGGGH